MGTVDPTGSETGNTGSEVEQIEVRNVGLTSMYATGLLE